MNTLETERLLLRHFTAQDAEAAHRLFTDPESMRLVGMAPAFTAMEQTRERIARWEAHKLHMAITEKATSELLGYIVINPDSEEGRADTRDIGYALLPEHRGHGYMHEALEAVCRGLKAEGIRWAWACCFEENIASERVIRSTGFQFRQKGDFYSEAENRHYVSLEFCREL